VRDTLGAPRVVNIRGYL